MDFDDAPPTYRFPLQEDRDPREPGTDLVSRTFKSPLLPPDKKDHPNDILFYLFPIDVIEIIFRFACAFNPQGWHRGLHPYTLLHVSSTWRANASNLSSLWRTIRLSIPFAHAPSGIQLVKDFLKKSRSAPLDIYIRHEFSPQRFFNRRGSAIGNPSASRSPLINTKLGIGPLFSVLFRHAERWRVFWVEMPHNWYGESGFQLPVNPQPADGEMPEVEGVEATAGGPSNQGADPLMLTPSDTSQPSPSETGVSDSAVERRRKSIKKATPFPRTLPNLEFLCLGGSIAVLSRSDPASQTDLQFNLRSAPRLTKLYLRRCTLFGIEVPLSNIEYLDIDHMTPSDVQKLFIKCRKLKTAIVSNFIVTNMAASSPHGPRGPSQLQELSILDTTSFHLVERLFQPLDLPHLDKLTLSFLGYLAHTKFFPRYIRMWGCPLTSLTLRYPMTKDDLLLELLEELPSLTELKLCDLLPSNVTGLPGQGYGPATGSSRDDRGRIHYGYLNGIEMRPSWDDSGPSQGLSNVFFEHFHPDAGVMSDEGFLPNLEVFEYEGALVVHAIDFLEPLLLRTGIRDAAELAGLRGYGSLARLRRIRIVADQQDGEGEFTFTLAEYTDASYLWEIMRLVEFGVLELLNSTGEVWM